MSAIAQSVDSSIEFATIAWRGQAIRIEYGWISPERVQAPLMVFLHEGLGSLAMWKDFPQQLCDALGCRGLVWSRPGYGRSTPRAPQEVWQADFMHRQAYEVMPALLQALGLGEQDKVWLFGHSDGASIALLYAARYTQQVTGVIALAPHIFVEDLSLASIEKARHTYQSTDLRQRLARYHDDPDSAFWGWNRAWLDPGFRAWSIEAEVARLRCPVLAIQGEDDEYGTMEQIRGIARLVQDCELLALAHCAHSPQRDQPQQVMAAVTDFFQRNSFKP
ncbi:MAG: hypothetical protein RLZZ596_2714 [Pseudomonadota bacterium]